MMSIYLDLNNFPFHEVTNNDKNLKILTGVYSMEWRQVRMSVGINILL